MKKPGETFATSTLVNRHDMQKQQSASPAPSMAAVRNLRRGFRRAPRGQRGYVLIVLMLFVALLAIAATAVAPMISFQSRRDREEEMIHRGVQYSRAIRRYYKKFGRYPVRIEDLESANNLRFLRKRYKDPVSGQDFKILHLGEVKLTIAPGIAGAAAVGPNGTIGGLPGNAGQAGAAAAVPASNTGQAGAAAAVPTSNTGQAGVLVTGASGNVAQTGAAIGGPAGNVVQTGAPVGGLSGNAAQPGAVTAGSPASSDSGNGQNPAQAIGPGASPSSDSPQPDSGTSSPSSGGKLGGKVFGGGPIVGVVSTSENETIREFNKKNHYNEWQFIYDPSTDRGGLLNTPAQPPLQGAVPTAQPAQLGVPTGVGPGTNPVTNPANPGPGAQPPGSSQPNQ